MTMLSSTLAFVLVLALAVSAFATSQFTNNIAERIAEKNANLSGNVPNPPEIEVGGETCANATPISVPGSSSGNTCDNLDNYDEACPYTGSTSGDEVYVISGFSGQVGVDLCNSSYDTKLYVYEGGCPGTLVACNDDACNDPSGNPFRSIDCFIANASSTYYVVVDGYFGDCGIYNISTYMAICCSGPCDPQNCPPGAAVEGEPVCFNGYVDAFNGGCNSTPNVFSPIACGQTVCGTGGSYMFDGLSYRDTDWYEFDLPVAGNVTATVCTSFDTQLAAIDGDVGCGFITIICGSVFGPPQSMLSCEYAAPSGLNWIFVATSAFSGVPCDSPYVLRVTCPDLPNATESKSWGGIKGLYR